MKIVKTNEIFDKKIVAQLISEIDLMIKLKGSSFSI